MHTIDNSKNKATAKKKKKIILAENCFSKKKTKKFGN